MLISYSWLKDHVSLPSGITPEEVAEKLKMSTVEVEDVVKSGQLFDNIVVGKVFSAEKHPNADKLLVCKVDVGNEKLDIVCGGSNVVPNMLVIVAKNGAKVRWHGEGELVELAPTKIRGVESNGMICGADEVGLADRFPKRSEKEIADLSDLKVKPGTPLADVVGQSDTVLEIDNKSLSNRPDLWGHYGIAREVAALTNRTVKPYATKPLKKGGELKLTATVDAELCSRYMAVAISGITIAPSPAWLQEKLTAVGVRPINNVVDVLNFVMFDSGQPLHAFDTRHISGNAITVRSAKAGEKLLMLDEKERELSSGMPVIASGKPIALAGIMGGLESGVQTDTKTIIIESATFNAVAIRKTSTKLGLRTDASARFEKSLDPNLAQTALEKAVQLLASIIRSAKVASNIVDVGGKKRTPEQLVIPNTFFEHKLGIDIPAKTTVSILSRLGFGVKVKSKSFIITVPTWRAKDVVCAEDVVEEVARMYGYDAIPSSLPVFQITPPISTNLAKLSRTLADLLVKSHAAVESYNYSFVSTKQITDLGDSVEQYIQLDNPLSKEKPFLRRSLLPNLLENIKNNKDYSSIRLFEIGKVFFPEEPGVRTEKQGDELLPRQDTMVTFMVKEKKNHTPFTEARRVVEELGVVVGGSMQLRINKTPAAWQHPVRAAEIMLRGQVVGSVYELHPIVATAYGINERVGVLEVNLSLMSDHVSMNKTGYETASPYPAVKRDIALLVKKDVIYAQVEKAIMSADKLLTGVELFDVYEGATIGKEYKSIALHLTFARKDRTLTSEEVDEAFKKITSALEKKVAAEVRV